MDIQIETVRVNGFSMDFFRFGKGDRTLVILPGLSVQSVMNYANSVSQSYRLLTDDFTVYVFDRRKELPAAYSVWEMAEDTAAAIRTLGLDRVCIFGASQGGMIGMAIAIRHPELVSRLVLGSTSACIGEEPFKTVENWIRLAGEGNAKDLCLAFGEAIYPPETFILFRDLLVKAAESVTGEELQRFRTLAESIKDFDVTDRLREIACPVLVIGSGNDRVLGSRASEQIAERLKGRPDCELYMYDGYGHAAYDLAPDYKERILRFLKKELRITSAGQ